MPSPKKSAKKKIVPAKPDRHIEMQLRHTFTQKELLEIAKKMAEASRELNQAEEEKKAVTSQLKAKVDGISARVTEHAGKINSGYEYRSTKVTVKYHTPKTGIKTLIRDDTGEVIENADMNQGEMQDEIKEVVEAVSGKFTNPVLTSENAARVTPATGTVQVAADAGSEDSKD